MINTKISDLWKAYSPSTTRSSAKGVFPYEWFDDADKLDYKGLPPRKAFYSTLKQDEAEEEQYEHALNV